MRPSGHQALCKCNGLIGIGAVAVSSYLSCKLLGDRRTAYHDFHLFADSCGFKRRKALYHVSHCGSEQCGKTENVCFIVDNCLDECLGVHIDTDIDDLEARAFKHRCTRFLPMS